MNESGRSVSQVANFFKVDPPECDYIISNPPYSVKGKVLETLFNIGKPFAMLVGVVGLFESQHRFNLFKNNDFEIMYMNKRISYFKDYAEQKPSLNPPFSSVYICSHILPKQIVFEEIDRKWNIDMEVKDMKITPRVRGQPDSAEETMIHKT